MVFDGIELEQKLGTKWITELIWHIRLKEHKFL
jgi:hypothetical protein